MKANINKFYLFNLFRLFSFFLPIYTIFYLSLDLNFFQIMLLGGITSIAQLILEIPSGILADKKGRKTSLIISGITRSISFIVTFLATNFTHMAIAMICFGISLSFESGTSSAFLYDTLIDLKRKNEYKKIAGRAYAFSLIGMALGATTGGLLAETNIRIPIAATLITSIIGLLITFTFKEPKRHKKSHKEHLKQAVKFTLNHKPILKLTLLMGILISILVISHRLHQPYIQNLNIELKWFGLIYFIWLMISAATSLFAEKIENKLGEKNSILIMPIIMAITFIPLFKLNHITGIILFIGGQFVWGFNKPITENFVNKHVESHHRATVLSLVGFSRGIALLILSATLGHLTDILGINFTLFIIGILSLLTIPLAKNIIT